MLLALAWRNLWRNSRRTIILVASVFFAVVISMFMKSMQTGQYEYMIKLAIAMYTGSIQIQHPDYREKHTLEESMSVTPDDSAWIVSRPHITHAAQRLETFSLIAHGTATKVSPITGIDPDNEDSITALRHRLISGAWLSNQDSGALLASGLARMLGVNVGDTIVLYGQGYHGITAAARVPVQGILKFPVPDLDNAMVYLALPYAQWLYSATSRVTSIVVQVDQPTEVQSVANDLRAKFFGSRIVLTWSDLLPDLLQLIQFKTAGGYVMLMILYVVVGFGILGTVMMMIAERRREYGILIAIGMNRRTMIATTTLETILVSMLGAVAGILIGVPLLIWMAHHPIPISGDLGKAVLSYGIEPQLPFSSAPEIFLTQGAIVLALGILCALYPWLVLRKLMPVEAMRGR